MQIVSPYGEKELLLRVSRGDEPAFRQLFEAYRSTLYTYLHKIVLKRETAEEILLDVFMKIWTGRDRLTSIDHFEAFLFRVARNMAIDVLRSAARQPVAEEIHTENVQLAGTDQADSSLLYEQAKQVLAEAIAQLSPQRRMVYELSREHGYSYEEIAQQMGLSAHSVRNYLAAAQVQVRDHVASRLPAIVLSLLSI